LISASSPLHQWVAHRPVARRKILTSWAATTAKLRRICRRL
jgi:hypothetical protein